jgi:hypothetical protein
MTKRNRGKKVRVSEEAEEFLDDFDAVEARLRPVHEAISVLLDPEAVRPESPPESDDEPSWSYSPDGNLLLVKNVFPSHVAEDILKILEAIPDKKWNATTAEDAIGYNNVSHRFDSIKSHPDLELAFRAMTFLAPVAGPLEEGEEEPSRLPTTFSAACYRARKDGADHIKPHDDRAFTDVKMDNGTLVLHSRSIAIILYLSRNWKREHGGVLLDFEDSNDPSKPKEYCPEFNSMVAFMVPRWHQVTDVTEPGKRRYSLFGWVLEEGMLYELDGDEGNGEGKANGMDEEKAETKEVPVPKPKKEKKAKEAAPPSDSEDSDEPPKRRRKGQWIVKDL